MEFRHQMVKDVIPYVSWLIRPAIQLFKGISSLENIANFPSGVSPTGEMKMGFLRQMISLVKTFPPEIVKKFSFDSEFKTRTEQKGLRTFGNLCKPHLLLTP